MNDYYIKNGMRVKKDDDDGGGFLDFTNIFIVMENGKHGIVREERNNVILPIEYDDVHCSYEFWKEDGTFDFLFELYRDKKVGLHKIMVDPETNEITQERIVDCVCDSIYVFKKFPFTYRFEDKKGFRYYCIDTGNASDYYKSIYDVNLMSDFIRACDGNTHYLINPETDEILFKKSLEGAYSSSWSISYIGSDNFYDLNENQLLIGNSGTWRMLDKYECIAPITTYPYPAQTYNNLANIIKDANGIGVVDHKGRLLIVPEYNEIAYELKITASKGREKVEVVVPVGKRNKNDTLYSKDGE